MSNSTAPARDQQPLDDENSGEWAEFLEDDEPGIDAAANDSSRDDPSDAASSSAGRSSTVFSGALEDMGTADLIQTLHMNRKSGVITLQTDRGIGTVWLSEGEVIDAEIGRLVGEQAVYRMLGVTEGRFVSRFMDIDRPQRITTDVMNLTMEGMRRVDEVNRMLAAFPALDVPLMVDEETLASGSIVLLPPSKEILPAFDERPCLRELLDDSETPDLELVSAIAPLVESGVVRAVPNAAPRRKTWPTMPDEVLMQLDTPIVSTQNLPSYNNDFSEVSSDSMVAGKPQRSRRIVGFAVGAVAVVALGWIGGTMFAGEAEPAAPVEAPPELVVAAAPQPEPPPPPCPDGMVFVESGTFFMGSQSESPVLRAARPAHQVTVDSYCIAINETSAREYKRCSDLGGCERAYRDSWWPKGKKSEDEWKAQRKLLSELCNENRPGRQTHPVNCVTWKQADAYCRWNGGRLPTEAEWEYAVRGSDGRVYPWGDQAPDHTSVNACGGECRKWREETGLPEEPVMYASSDGYAGTSPVGSFPEGRTQRGLFDVVGNVFEWTATPFHTYTGEAVRNPNGPASGDSMIIRGGAFNSFMPEFADPALRFPMVLEAHSHGIGFRCAANPNPNSTAGSGDAPTE
ncbi:MAG: DUF4388 domain-containing protein [Myxococcales bacterium FL481]|nr:MAG: DUF4388 domain-containing protein [Myxococcales bacterium FL481]